MKLNRALYTDKDKTLVLEEGDPKAAFVIGGEGSTVDAADVEKYGLDESHFISEEKPTDEDDDKPADAAADVEEDETDEEDEEKEPEPAPAPKKPAAAKKTAKKK